LESLAVLADAVLDRNLQVVDEYFVGLVVDHVAYGARRQSMSERLTNIDEKDRHAIGALAYLFDRCRAREQYHQVRMLQPRRPDFLAVDDVTVALLDGGGGDLGGIRAGGRLSHSHRLQPQIARRNLWQVKLLLRFRTVAQQRVHVVHLAMTRSGVC